MADLTPEQQEAEEFEFRARAEEEARARQIAAQNSAAQTNQGNEEPSMLGKIAGAAAIPFQIAAEHPWETGAALGLYKAGKVANTWIDKTRMETEAAREMAAQRAEQAAANVELQKQRIAERQARTAPKPTAPVEPVQPKIIDPATGRPFAPAIEPVAPPTTTPMTQGVQAAENIATKAPTVLDKTTSMIRQLAANKVFQGLARGANILGTAQLAAYSPELGPPVPQVGRMRGMEINPMTGRPWTPEQLKAYNANPSLYDSALGAAQMPR